MHLFPRKPKSTPGAFYFGDFEEVPLAPFSVSLATFDTTFLPEPKHYHEKNQKVYIVISGKAILDVDGEKVELSPEVMVHVEPMEVHSIEKIVEGPFLFVVVASSKVSE